MLDRQVPWARVVLIAILLACAAWVVTHLEWQEESARSGFTGEARKNPYHAGMLLITQSGYPAKRVDDAIALDGLSAQSTLLLNSPALFNNRTQAAKLEGWVRRGGHLVLPLNRHDDLTTLLTALKLQTLGWNETTAKLQQLEVEGASAIVDLRNAAVFDVLAETEWTATLSGHFDEPEKNEDGTSPEDTDDQEDSSDTTTQPAPRAFKTDKLDKIPVDELESHAVYARWKLGQGHVTAGSFAPFRNVNIEDDDHGALFVRLLTLPKDKRPVFVALTAEYPSLFTWLARHAGEALIALAILLAALLWRAMPRFGPALPAIAPTRPGLLQHLGAVGDFLLREKQYEALIAPLREDVVVRLTHLRSRHPEIGSLAELGAQLAQLSVDEVSLALTPEPADAHDFQRRSRTLATLRKHCSRMQNAFSPEGS